MRINELLTPERTRVDLEGGSKKRLLDEVARLAEESTPGLGEQEIFDALIARERLGSTGIGEGVAIPHCRLASCQRPVGLLLRLAEPVDFDAADGQAVDIVFVLMVPEEDPEKHLKTLSHLAALFNEPSFRAELRKAEDARQLYRNAVESEAELELAS
jgi:PTS system nitrogen regulatory IIA component